MSKLCRALVLIEAVHYRAISRIYLIRKTLLVEALSMRQLTCVSCGRHESASDKTVILASTAYFCIAAAFCHLFNRPRLCALTQHRIRIVASLIYINCGAKRAFYFVTEGVQRSNGYEKVDCTRYSRYRCAVMCSSALA